MRPFLLFSIPPRFDNDLPGAAPGVTLLRWVLQSIAVLAGTCFSPAWPLFAETVKSWIHLEALADPNRAVAELAHFQHLVQLNREMATDVLLPKLFLIFLITVALLVFCNEAGRQLARVLLLPRGRRSFGFRAIGSSLK